MADHKQALKRHRQSQKRALRNSHYRSTLKTFMKRAADAVANNSPEAEQVVSRAIAMVDKVRGKGIIPRSRGSRYVSRLSRMLNKTD